MTASLLVLAVAGTVDGSFERASEAYHRGDFAEAVAGYERVIALGVGEPDLYYNLGSAYLRLGRVGHAIWGYERALGLAPDHEDAAWNLGVARKQVLRRDKLEGGAVEPFWIRAVTAIRLPTLMVSFLVVYLGLFAALLARRWAGGVGRAGLGAAAALLFSLSVVLGVFLAGRDYHDDHVKRGIVLPDEVSVAEGPEESARVAFRIHGGLKVRLMDREDEWVRVRLLNGLEGWVRDREVGRL